MKKRMLIVFLSLVCCLAGCGAESGKSDNPQVPAAEGEAENARKQSTESEEQHAYLPENFFNNWVNRNESAVGENCLTNLCLDSFYDSPENVDLYRLFSSGFGIEVTEEDREFLKTQGEQYDLDIAKIPGEKINEILQQYFDISFGETNKIGLDKFCYREETDTYYRVATNVPIVNLEKQYVDENGNINVLYTRGETENEKRIAVIKLKGNRFVFMSNKPHNS